jgi:coproporphyrinogen III oxidase
VDHERLVDAMEALVRDLQERIVTALEAADGTGRFGRDAWSRPGGGGGGSK